MNFCPTMLCSLYLLSELAHSAVSCSSVPSTCAVCDQVYYVTFTEWYIKTSLRVANTETFKPPKRGVLPGTTTNFFHNYLIIY